MRTNITSDRFDQREIEEMVSHRLASIRANKPHVVLTPDD